MGLSKMEEFLIFFAIVLVIAVVVAFWPLIVAVVALMLIICIISAVKSKKKKRLQEEQRQQEQLLAEKRRSLEKKRQHDNMRHSEITNELGRYISEGGIDCAGIINYIVSIESEYRHFAMLKVGEHEKEIAEHAISRMGAGDMENAAEAFKLLSKLNPDSGDYAASEKTAKELLKHSRRIRCFMMTEEYGIPRQDILDGMLNGNPGICNSNMQEYGLIYSLWFNAVHRPFDQHSYIASYAAASRIRPKYYRCLVDVLLSLAYLEAKYGENTAASVCPGYRKDILGCIQKADKRMLEEMASAMNWMSNNRFELECLRRLESSNYLSAPMKIRYYALKAALAVE